MKKKKKVNCNEIVSFLPWSCFSLLLMVNEKWNWDVSEDKSRDEHRTKQNIQTKESTDKKKPDNKTKQKFYT